MSAPDKNVERNRQLLLDRSLAGLKKYGVTTERRDLTHKQWMQHLLEELLDAANYVQASMHNQALPAIPFGQGCNVSVLSHTLDSGEPSLTLRHLDQPVVGLTFKTEEHKLAVLQALLCGNSFAEQSAACDAANEYCQEHRIGEWGGSTVRGLIAHHKRLREQLAHSHKQEQRLDDQITELKALKFKSFAGEECWIWQGDESDNLATLICPVVIQPADLQEIIRQRDEAMQLATEAQQHTATQLTDQADKITVTRSALKEVLTCLISEPMFIRELQATRTPKELFPDNPINKLLAEFEGSPHTEAGQ